MRVLVTGATGFVGRNLLPLLDSEEVSIVVREPDDSLKHYPQILYSENLENFQQEIEQYNPEAVIHLASFLSSADDFKTIKNVLDSNILFTSYLLAALKNTDMRLFVNTGTFAEYYYNDGTLNPAYFYSASKTAARSFVKYFQNLGKFKSIDIVPYTIYGGVSKSKKVIDYILDSTGAENPVGMTSGEQILDFIHIDDVVDFYVHCIRHETLLQDGSVYHLGSGRGTSIRDLATLIESKTGKKTKINWGAREYRPLDIMRAVAPVYRLKKELNWEAKVNLEDGVQKIIDESY